MASASDPPAKSSLSNRSLRARFGLALLVAFVLHVPATPLARFFSFLSTFIDLKDSERVDYGAAANTPISVELADPPQPKPAPKDKVNAVQVESDRPGDVVKLPKGEERQSDGKPESDEKDPLQQAAEEKKKPEEKKKTPEALGVTGEMTKSVEGKSNVTFTVWFSTMRDYPSADSLRPMLSCGFLGAAFQRSGVDPIRDLDGALFAGQKLNDPAKYVVAIHHHMPKEQVHDAVDKLVRPKGAWIEPDVAKFHAAKATRVVFPHGSSLLFITPETGWQQVRGIKKPLGIPQGRGRVLSLNLLKPSIPFKKFGLRLPDSIAEMRLDLFLSVTGTAELQLHFEDRDEPSAARHAPEIHARLKDFLWQLQSVSDLTGLLGSSQGQGSGSLAIPEVPMMADGKAIVGQATLSEEQTKQLVEKMSSLMCAKPKPQGSASAAPSAPAPAAPPPAGLPAASASAASSR
jgi:hypothetical protein